MECHNYTILTEVFDAIISGKKTVEIRSDDKKQIIGGDIICFHEHYGSRNLWVWVDKAERYENFSSLIHELDEPIWRFEPFELCTKLMEQEFGGDNKQKRVQAIFFHVLNVSVIMPCYNVSSYIDETLQSLAKQTYKAYELIIMDDGSTDNTKDIVSNYRNIMPIRFIENEHSGPAKLRTMGMKLAYGKYIIFLDSDDLFEPDFFAEMVSTLETSTADIAIAEYDSFLTEDGYYYCSKPAYVDEFVKKSSEKTVLWKELPEHLSHWTNVPWNKMYKKTFLDKLEASFQDLPCSNDVYFSHYTMSKALIKHISSCNSMVHYRIGRKKSISENHDCFSELSAYQKVLQEISDMDAETIDKVYDDFISGIMKCIRWGRGERHRAFFDYIKQDIITNHKLIPKDYMDKKYSWLKNIFMNYDYGDSIYTINFLIIKSSELKKKELQQSFFELANESMIGIMEMNKELQFLRHKFEVSPINWVVDDECKVKRPYVLIITSPLQVTKLELFIEKNELYEAKVIALY